MDAVATLDTRSPSVATRPRAHQGISVALAGSGGSGVMTAGTLLLEAAAKAGLYGLMVRTSGPQIRGGEAAALVRIADAPVDTLDDAFQLLLAIDWLNIHQFVDEIPLAAGSIVIGDADEGECPEAFRRDDSRFLHVALKKAAKAIAGSWTNMVALGVAGALANLPTAALEAAVREGWKRDDSSLTANLLAVRAGVHLAHDLGPLPVLAQRRVRSPAIHQVGARWLLSGNEAAGYGAVRGGVRFVAAYPITPATELLEWMAPALQRIGGTLVQAEDELASVNMAIGASYGGVPALTATAGPGLALMTEALGLAVAAEIPLVVVDVMRGGPSTGIPAKSEQSDLSFAVNGLHGDAPRLVLAPTSIADCIETTQWAAELAEALQAPAIVLSDQFMGQTRATIDRPRTRVSAPRRVTAPAAAANYKRYANTESGVSPMAVPGTPGVAYTADGLEHTETGLPTSNARAHALQLDKRARKLDAFDYGARWADVEGDASLAVITFGSTSGAVREAARHASDRGVPVRVITIRLLAPLKPDLVRRALAGVSRAIVVEQNHGGQLHRYLRSMVDFDCPLSSFHRPGPLPLRPGTLAQMLLEWSRT